MQRRWFSRPRFVGSRSAGSPFLVMHTWSLLVRIEYGSRASNPLTGTKLVRTFFLMSTILRGKLLNMYTNFPSLPYSFTFIAIFICMLCVVFSTYTLFLFVFFFFYKFDRHLCHGAYWYTHNPAHMSILFFLLHRHFSNSCVCVSKHVNAFASSSKFIHIHCHIHISTCFDYSVITPYNWYAPIITRLELCTCS